MISPCIHVCSLDTKTGLCIGCGRTGAEIGGWTGFSERERIAIMASLPARFAALDLPADMKTRRALLGQRAESACAAN